MAFEPDIIISTPDGRLMVIEAKVAMHDLPHTEEALKHYMVAMQYPFGLLITPEKGWVYRDSYSSLSPASIQKIEEFDSVPIWRQKPPREPLEFEAFVRLQPRWKQAWLAEAFFFWGFAAAMACFAITLNPIFTFGLFALSIVFYLLVSRLRRRSTA